MNPVITITQNELSDFLLNVALIRPVFIWGAPGIGKSFIIQQFADSLGLPCVSLLGSQLAPEDIMGVPQIQNGVSRFCPPAMIARSEPYCLFLDELNACSHEVQKSFYRRGVGHIRLNGQAFTRTISWTNRQLQCISRCAFRARYLV